MKATIKLDTRAKGRTEEGFPIILYLTDKGKKRTVHLGFRSREANWNATTAAPRTSHPKYYELNDYLLKVKSKIAEIMGNRMLDGKVNINNFKENLFQETSPIFYKAAIGLLPQDYIGTKLSALRSFDSYFPDITFNEISSATVDRYIRNLREKGNSPGGIDSYVRSLKALWNKLSNKENPFKGHRIPIPPRIKKVSTPEDIRKLASAQLSDKGLISSYSKLRDYWLLMFYFGGIDPEVLARLRYDRNIQNGRLVFNRGKGGSNMPCNNIIAPQALEILGKYDCRPYLVPIYRSTSPKSFIRNFRRGLIRISDMLELGVVMHPKSARYSFIDRAQQELIDERITAQIVGHKRRTTTSLYTNDFPIEVQDKAHLKIISLS